MLIHWLFALAFVKCIAKPHSSSDSLMTVFILARHGERYPCHHLRHPSYPKEFNLRSCQLTENGAQQHYKLGQFIYDRYSNLLTSKGFKQREIHIRSTGSERTILSATYFALGLNSKVPSQIPLIPPIFSSPKRYDYLLKMSSPCPAFKKISEASLDSDLSRDFAQSERRLFEELKNFTGFKYDNPSLHSSLSNLWKICEPIYVWDGLERTAKGASLPFSPELAESCHRALSFRKQLLFASPRQTFLRGGPLWDHVLLTLQRLSASAMSNGIQVDAEEFDALDISVPPETRLMAYFAHDSTIAAFLSHVGIFNNILPPYTSAVIVELHRMSDGELGLKFFYHNSTEPSLSSLVALTSPLCTDEKTMFCGLETLKEQLRGKAATDVEAACSLEADRSSFSLAITALIASFAFAYILPIGFTVRALLCLVSILLTYRALFFLS